MTARARLPAGRCRLCGTPILVADRLAAIPSAFDSTGRGGQRDVVNGMPWDASVSWVHARCARPLRPGLAAARATRLRRAS